MANLIRCGEPKWHALQHGWVKNYWRVAGMKDCIHAMCNDNLYSQVIVALWNYVSVS